MLKNNLASTYANPSLSILPKMRYIIDTCDKVIRYKCINLFSLIPLHVRLAVGPTTTIKSEFVSK